MTLIPFRPAAVAARRLGAVPWYHDGYHGLSVRVTEDVPTFDDPMIRSALIRAAMACDRIESLDRALSRELWTLGYVARLDVNETGLEIIGVEVASSR
jgi:hypothetical protein